MEILPLSKPYFSPVKSREKFWLLLCWIVTAVSTLILIFAWNQTRNLGLIVDLQQWRKIVPVEYFFRAFTFLGDDQFFMIFFGIVLWCVNKSLGFWTAFVLLTSGTLSNLIKDLTLLERPPIPGVTHPKYSWAFPSGHTLTAITVWGYLAVRIKKTGFWIWAVAAMLIIGFSRLVLGFHYLGDILGGIALGLPFLLTFIWLSVQFVERGWVEKFTVPMLLGLSVVVPVALTAIFPGADPPKIFGYLAGASIGYILEKEKVRSLPATKLPLQFLKVILGLGVLFGIIMGLSPILPSGGPEAAFGAKMAGFIRYAIGGIWATLLAPLLFVALRLTPRLK